MQLLQQWNPKLEHARFGAFGISEFWISELGSCEAGTSLSALSQAASRTGSITTLCPYMGHEKLDTLNHLADSVRLIQVKQFDFQ